jgi:REP element-mobilizing transposase RayT
MGRKYAIRDQQAIYFVTFTTVNWIDLFIRNEYRKILVQSLKYCQDNKGLNIHAYCIMTSHIHLILSAKEGFSLSDIIRDMKSYTSMALKTSIREHSKESRKEWLMWFFERAGKKNKRNQGFQLWQQHNHPIE